MNVPFSLPSIDQDEIDEVTDCLRSGWMTTGPKTKRFESEFASYVGRKHAVAVNSATAALHLALEAIGLKRGDAVLVPTMTFAATAEVVRHFDAKPVLVDCCEADLNIDVRDARRRAQQSLESGEKLRAIIPMHYGGQATCMTGVLQLAQEFDLRVIEDAAHCCPAGYRQHDGAPWRKVGDDSDVSCYSFCANSCITTGDGGMACTDDADLAERMRIMSLHGISKDAWKRFSAEGSWSYEIVAPGFKYNLTDLAAAIGIHQLRKADEFRSERARVATRYRDLLGAVQELILPGENPDRLHSWHLFTIRLRLDRLTIDRAAVADALKKAGIGTSVHWIPLHLHPYYRTTYGLEPKDYPVATRLSREILCLPIFPGMRDEEIRTVTETLSNLLAAHRRKPSRPPAERMEADSLNGR
jgi:dTDP-4-amino-4,6-dideoxygalactose transaminase